MYIYVYAYMHIYTYMRLYSTVPELLGATAGVTHQTKISTCDNRLCLLVTVHCMTPRFLWVHFWPGTVQSRSLQL